jgi:hypothetical protein
MMTKVGDAGFALLVSSPALRGIGWSGLVGEIDSSQETTTRGGGEAYRKMRE